MKHARRIVVLCLALVIFISPALGHTKTPAPSPAAVSPGPATNPAPVTDPQPAPPGLLDEYIVRGSGKQVGRATATQELLVSLAEDLVKVRAVINYNFTNAPAPEVRISVPAGYMVMDARGDGITLSKVAGGRLTVKFARPMTGNYQLIIEMEKAREQASGDEPLPELVTDGLARESGYVAVEVRPGLEATIKDSNRLTAIDPSELPPGLRGSQPALFSYQFTRHPYAVTVSLARYSQITTLNATIDTANLVTFLTAEGRLLTRAIYEVRNNRKQYLKLSLPGAAEVWSVYVNDKPVTATTDGKGQFFLPLMLGVKDDFGNTSGNFKVEIIYYVTISKLDKKGELKAIFPKTDLPISEMLVSLYLPARYKFDDFEGTLERLDLDELPVDGGVPSAPERISQGERKLKNSEYALTQQARMENEIAEEARRQAPAAGPAYAADVNNSQMYAATGGALFDVQNGVAPYHRAATDVTGGAAGALPVRFSVPLRGQMFRFTKLVVVNETPELTFNYKKTWKKAAWMNPWRWGKVVLWAALVALLVAVTRWTWRRPRPMTPATVEDVTFAEPEPEPSIPGPALDGLTPATNPSLT